MLLLRSVLLIVLCGFNAVSAQNARSADSLVNSGWNAWFAADYSSAETQFRAALIADASCTRAHVGLALLHSMREEYIQCWDAIRGLEKQEKNIYPYLFSFGSTLRFKLKNQYRETGLLDYLIQLASAPDDRGILAGQVAETLEEYYRERRNLDEMEKWRARVNAVGDWMLIGPFENVSASGYDKTYPPEFEYNPTATYEGKSGIPASWFPVVSTRPNTWIDFTRHFPNRQSIFYANTFVFSPSGGRVHLRIGTSGSFRAFLNDDLVMEYEDENNNDLDTYIASTELQKGWNRLLIKCGCSEIDKCNFLVRITDEHGRPVDGLRVSTASQTYLRKPLVKTSVLDNAFETYFSKQIETFPDRPENYALLAQLHLRDDKASQAEIILRSALQRWPKGILFYTLLMEAYERGEKKNEVEELVKKISAIDDQLPTVIGYRIRDAILNESYPAAQELVDQLRKQGYNPEALYQIEIGLLGKKKDIDRLVTLTATAYAQYPLNWELANLQAVIESEINRSPLKAAEVVGAYLKRSYGLEQLNTLASYYLKAGKFDKWEETMKEALALSPTATGYVHTMGLVYQLAKDYKKAEAAFRHALELCPGGALYWSKLAEVYKATGKTDEAKNAYQQVLKFESRDFASRDALRELEGKKPVFSVFSEFNIDSLIHAAPDQSAYPDDGGVVLVKDEKRVVFEKGASMLVSEMVVKLFNTDGIDAWKEYSIFYNSYNEELFVEKAVTIKMDGTEVKADVNRGRVVFKSIETGDCIRMKWKIKNFYNGMLASHFWDTHYFNMYYPVRIDRYALLVPNDARFTHRTQFTPDEPSVRSVEEGVMYEWRLMDEPAIKYEQGMPVLEDVGKVLFISSLPSWEYVADWYSDLARTKTRVSFEIKDAVAKLLEGKSIHTEDDKVKAIYDFITENIRYSSVSFRQSALVPQRARDVLVQRIGDCKDKSTLCIAMLKEAGIKAHYVLVNTWDEGLNRNAPPSIAFNHCIVSAETKAGSRFIDLTASNYSMGSIPRTVNGAFALPIEPGKQSPAYLETDRFAPNNISRITTALLNKDNSLAVNCLSRRSGYRGAGLRSRYRNKSISDQTKELTEILGRELPNVKVTDVSVTDIDHLDPVIEDRHSYTVPQFVSETGGFKIIRMPWADRLDPEQSLSYETRTYPYVIGITRDTLSEVLRVVLPAGYTVQELPGPFRRSSASGEYAVTYKLLKSELTGTRVFVYKKPTVSPEEYDAFKKFYNEALKEDNRQILLKKIK